jgi:hypothetical protein
MSGIQSLLAIGAVWLFALVTINFNSTVVHNISIEVENKVYLDAFSLADDMIEEIKQKRFDEKDTLDYKPPIPDSLSFIGPDFGETKRDLFDDMDDYDGFKDTVGLPYVEKFLITTAVSYADPDNNFNGNYGSKTFYKRVDVKVESLDNYLTNPVNLSFIFALHSR